MTQNLKTFTKRLPFHSIILRSCFVCAAIFGASGVALAALAAHLPTHLFASPQDRENLQSAATMSLWHGTALLVLCFNIHHLPRFRGYAICLGMTLGTWLFSASISLHSFGILAHASLAPLGGSILILSWLALITTLPKPTS